MDELYGAALQRGERVENSTSRRGEAELVVLMRLGNGENTLYRLVSDLLEGVARSKTYTVTCSVKKVGRGTFKWEFRVAHGFPR